MSKKTGKFFKKFNSFYLLKSTTFLFRLLLIIGGLSLVSYTATAAGSFCPQSDVKGKFYVCGFSTLEDAAAWSWKNIFFEFAFFSNEDYTYAGPIFNKGLRKLKRVEPE